ncbi:Gag-Pol polyprotein, partial [Harpegnathos saltator]
CYRCLEKGHVQATCKSDVDRSKNCYRCGETGHLARDCKSKARCQICAAGGKPADHRMDRPAC